MTAPSALARATSSRKVDYGVMSAVESAIDEDSYGKIPDPFSVSVWLVRDLVPGKLVSPVDRSAGTTLTSWAIWLLVLSAETEAAWMVPRVIRPCSSLPPRR